MGFAQIKTLESQGLQKYKCESGYTVGSQVASREVAQGLDRLRGMLFFCME